MDTRYLHFCHPGNEFYDQRTAADESVFDLAADELPVGWSRVPSGPWIGLRPPEQALPTQGWKIHATAQQANADKILTTVWDYCRAGGIALKFLRSREALAEANAKYADRGSSGKFITVYPADERQLRQVLTELGAALDGETGPYVLSDLRWRKGPLFTRYGGFAERTVVTGTGDRVHAIENPAGELVPDNREPRFRTPSWVRLPEFLRQPPSADESADELPYRPTSALHFSNGGGVYLAEDLTRGGEVVLKEARPYAGLDVTGSDAVTRLEREAKVLDRLAGLDVVPAFHGTFHAWEHHFIAMEKIDGLDLKRAVMQRIPILKPHSTPQQTADYAQWALAVLDRIDAAMTAIHERGVVIGDVHPKNILLRDDRPVFLDFEFSAVDDPLWAVPQGAPGFKPPRELRGTAADRWALGAIRLDMFVPLTQMVEYEPGKVRQLIDAARTRYGLPASFAEKVLRDMFGTAEADVGLVRPATEVTRRFLGIGEPAEWPRVCDSIAEGILASATPDREDRLFPGDVEQFLSADGLGFAHGAAGVLHTLAVTGHGRHPEHEDWLLRRLATAKKAHAGFYHGLHGIAYALEGIGRTADARNVLDRALELPAWDSGFDLYRGAAGVGLTLLHFADRYESADLRERAVEIAGRLADTLAASAGQARTDAERGHAGLMKGWTGAALLGIRLHQATGDGAHLDLAADALRRDLLDCTYTVNNTLEADDGYRTLPYLEVGTAGVGMVIGEYLRHRPDEEFRTADAGIDLASSYEFYVMGTLFAGRAGMLMALCQRRALSPSPSVETRIARLLADFGHQGLPYRGHIAFQGNQALRLSMDLATGSAGVLLALHTALDGGPGLPFLPLGG